MGKQWSKTKTKAPPRSVNIVDKQTALVGMAGRMNRIALTDTVTDPNTSANFKKKIKSCTSMICCFVSNKFITIAYCVTFLQTVMATCFCVAFMAFHSLNLGWQN